MRLRVLLPHDVLVDRDDVSKVVAESLHGVFALLPRHIDFVAPVVPGILQFEHAEGTSSIGVDSGILVKRGPEVRVSVHDAVQAEELEEIHALVRKRFRALDEREDRARAAMARLEASFYHRFIEQQEALRGG